MSDEKRLIDANALMEAFRKYMAKRFDRERCVSEENCKVCDRECLWRRIVKDAPTVDAVSKGVHDQVRWERDVAMEQLEEHGIPFGGIAPDVVKVVHGKWAVINDYCCVCSVCHNASTQTYYYCPECGAKMDGGNENG